MHTNATQHILEKNWIRSDALWTRALLFRGPMKRIPLWMDVHALLQSQYWQKERFHELQTTLLRTLLLHAQTLPLWKERLKDVDTNSQNLLRELQKLPLSSKKFFLGHDRASYVDRSLVAQSTYDQTSGSTATPFGFYHDRGFALRSYGICERMFRVAGSGRRYPVVSMRSRARLGFAFKKYSFFHVRGFSNLRYRYNDLKLLLDSLGEKVVLFGFSSTIVELAHIVAEHSDRLPLQAILVAGEELSEGLRSEIEKTLRVPVYKYYAMGELGRLAFECEHRSLHINEEWAYIEVVDEHGLPLPQGKKGRIVATVFDNTVMPFIRYETGDLGTIEDKKCKCGRTLRVMSLQGREFHTVSFPDGRTVSALGIASVIDRYLSKVRQYQIVRRGPYAFLLRIVPKEGFGSVQEDLREHFSRFVHPKAKVELELVENLEAGATGKAHYYIEESA